MKKSTMNHLEYIHCPTCGLTLEEIREEHKIGCQDCLVVFREAIEQILIEKMGSITYGGQYVARQDISSSFPNTISRTVQLGISSDGLKDDAGIASKQTMQKKSEAKLTSKEMQASLLELKKLLERSVAAEDYEAAIYFRNEIKRLEQV